MISKLSGACWTLLKLQNSLVEKCALIILRSKSPLIGNDKVRKSLGNYNEIRKPLVGNTETHISCFVDQIASKLKKKSSTQTVNICRYGSFPLFRKLWQPWFGQERMNLPNKSHPAGRQSTKRISFKMRNVSRSEANAKRVSKSVGLNKKNSLTFVGPPCYWCCEEHRMKRNKLIANLLFGH